MSADESRRFWAWFSSSFGVTTVRGSPRCFCVPCLFGNERSCFPLLFAHPPSIHLPLTFTDSVSPACLVTTTCTFLFYGSSLLTSAQSDHLGIAIEPSFFEAVYSGIAAPLGMMHANGHDRDLPERVAVIGAGPVGCLAALAFAQRGCSVDVYESRPDPRTHEAVARAAQRSINLALSTRGITGLRSVSVAGQTEDLADLVLRESVPMRARMIHTTVRKASPKNKAEVREDSQIYSSRGEWINSVDRSRLNNILLQHASDHANINIHFEHRLQNVDFDYHGSTDRATASEKPSNGDADGHANGHANYHANSHANGRANGNANGNANGHANGHANGRPVSSDSDRIRFEFDVRTGNANRAQESVVRYADLVIGCDGAHSQIRTSMSKIIAMDYSHDYIDSEYVELSIPPRTSLGSGSRTRGNGGLNGTKGGHDAFHLDPNHLHIWPRHSFMLIALPNLDGSFTCTLFAPSNIFTERLHEQSSILAFFEEFFPDALPLIGEKTLVECLMTRKPSRLGSVKCKPYHYKDRAVLIGDAAHAMLPFYGQGLNCGFEDVRVLFEHIDRHPSLSNAFATYTETRHPDLLAICQLAENNYTEMAHKVVSTPYLLRKKLDSYLTKFLPPSYWQSLYEMVTFSNTPYAQIIKREKLQHLIISTSLLSITAAVSATSMLALYHSRFAWKDTLTRFFRR
ncbi:LOW QUALITY PROTEIN: FAD/NAD(P)-binding domain-containing protein [Testicularia cyperi]|uniref:Kynurenine 3-monooxygenase n=1 Tax=Testicularia cyperi TaxID=1882483 RepID=A0A317XR38_9BASI|nr:LOW QUALITY PROTEIN: FAD/NAD(P)-binding domain-containing protein [Testicularia cyperi]